MINAELLALAERIENWRAMRGPVWTAENVQDLKDAVTALRAAGFWVAPWELDEELMSVGRAASYRASNHVNAIFCAIRSPVTVFSRYRQTPLSPTWRHANIDLKKRSIGQPSLREDETISSAQ